MRRQLAGGRQKADHERAAPRQAAVYRLVKGAQMDKSRSVWCRGRAACRSLASGGGEARSGLPIASAEAEGKKVRHR